MSGPTVTRSGVVAGMFGALLLAGGCDTRVVELTTAPDGGPTPTCSEFIRADGARCRLCFGEGGLVTMASCAAPLPDAAQMTPPAASCKIIVGGDERCLLCASGNTEYRSCLKCDAPVPRMTGGQCRVCTWSDDLNNRCLQCFARDGTRDEDTCDGIRGQPVVYPMGSADAGGGR